MSADQESRLHPFASLYRHGFVRVAAAVPRVRIGDPVFNAERTLALARQVSDAGAALVIFPELGISGYSIDDLLHQTALLDSVVAAIGRIAEGSESVQPAIVVGAPLRAEYGVFNAAVVIHRGRVLGVVPKSYLPEYREYYEKRQFRAARDLVGDRIRVGSSAVPFGTDLLFASRDLPPFIFHVEICEDLWAPIARSRTPRSPARPCSPTFRTATSRSARPASAASCARRSPPGRSPATCTPPPAWASPRPTWPGTATP